MGLQEQFARLRRFRNSIHAGDGELVAESMDVGPSTAGFEAMPSAEQLEDALGLESIAMRRERPVLAIRENVTDLVFVDAVDSEIWKERLIKARPHLDRTIPAVGRINLAGGPLDWVGTGWLIAENIIVTNRHVAQEFVTREGDGFTFTMGSSGPIVATTDFLQEIGNTRTLVFALVRPLHVSDPSGPDVAFFEIAMLSGDQKLAVPIDLAGEVKVSPNVATIGYPAYDSRIPEPDLMERIYGKVYNKKRLAPGGVTRIEPTRILHNCTTLGGNSGSVVIDLDEGKALGLHFSGRFLDTNYAVRADVVKKLLDEVRRGRVARSRPAAAREQSQAASVVLGDARLSRQARGDAATFTLPLTITVSIPGAQLRPAVVKSAPILAAADGAIDDADTAEAVAADYRDRTGYAADFLGQRFSVDLPKVRRNPSDVLGFAADGGGEENVLRYQHFSVVMSRSRRMCFFSACNIDGNLSKKGARVGWKWDPRIPREQQIMKECYGSPPKFSRGHMTRREDPGWGNAVTAKRGNEDSMHVTNATPQMQAFNSPIWLALEDYALQHAREDDMKVSVFTGPYFGRRDPEMYGVKIPLAFWKVIAFIHDETGELCATGYDMDQQGSLQSEEEFVFGQFVSPQLNLATQVPIASIAARAGLDLGVLAQVDPLASDEESVAPGARAPLLALEQIRFLS